MNAKKVKESRDDLLEAVRLVCGCQCDKCVRVVTWLADEGCAWHGPNPPCGGAADS